MNLPDSAFLSAPLWLVTALHLLTLTLHFAAMNFLLGGLILAVYAGLRKRWDEPALLGLARLFPSAMAATVTLGVAPLLFLQLVFPRQAYAAAITSAWFWLLVVVAVIVAYYALYRAAFRGERTGRASLPALALALAGLVYVSLVYSSVFSMAEQPPLIRDLYAADASGWVWNPDVSSYAARWLHMVLGAITVGGFCVALLGRDSPAVRRLGTRFFVAGLLLASAAGVAYLVTLRPILPAFMRSPAAWALTAAILLALGALHPFRKGRFWLAGLMLFAAMLGMVYARHAVRLLHLAGQFDPASWRIAPQWGPFALFLVCFVLMLAALAYMLRLFFTARPPSRA